MQGAPRRWLIKILLVVTVMLSSACSRLLFYPDSDWQRTPADVGVAYRDIHLTAADGIALSAWWLPAQGEPRGTVLFLHGNAENISTHLASVYWLPEQGYQVLLLDYRGYGKSQGSPSLPEVFLDIDAALDWLLASGELRDQPLYVLGQSLGASLASYSLASHPQALARLDGVVLDAAFTGYSDIAQEVASRSWLTWLFQYPVAWSMPSGFDPVDHIAAIAPVPVLIVHGRQDQVIPYAHGQALMAAAGSPKSMLSYDGPHIATFMDMENRQHLLTFLRDAPARKRAASAAPE